MYTLELFMWGYQQYFQLSAQLFAESLFKELDSHFIPKVFLLGVLVENVENRHLICLEPEGCGYKPECFSNIKDLAEQLVELDEEKKILHSHPIAQESHEHRIKIRALKTAIEKIIKRENPYSDILTFVSGPAKVEEYLVFVVLQLNRNAYESHYTLTKNKFNQMYSISTSLVESTIKEYLEIVSKELSEPDAGAGLSTFSKIGVDETIRLAGKYFMYTIASVGRTVHGLHGLYDTCNFISSLKYEGLEGLGTLIIARKDHPNIKMNLILKDPILLREFRKVRKFLELSNNENCLISDSEKVYGLGQVVDEYNPGGEDLFVIDFTGHYTWEVRHAGTLLMRVSYNQPSLPKSKFDREKFYSDLERIFKPISKNEIDNLWRLTLEVTKQRRGTILVVSSGAREEAERLGNQCFKVEPTSMNQELINLVTNIDGAVLTDPYGKFYAIGVILDGLATDKGDPARGARYNSAIRYYEYIKDKHRCIIIIISEDGMIDLIPDLIPQIKVSAIEGRISDLKTINREEKVDVKKFNFAMSWLEDREFYLSEKHCREINDLRKSIEGRFNAETLRIVRRDLVPNPEMNASYFINEQNLSEDS